MYFQDKHSSYVAQNLPYPLPQIGLYIFIHARLRLAILTWPLRALGYTIWQAGYTIWQANCQSSFKVHVSGLQLGKNAEGKMKINRRVG